MSVERVTYTMVTCDVCGCSERIEDNVAAYSGWRQWGARDAWVIPRPAPVDLCPHCARVIRENVERVIESRRAALAEGTKSP